jgi:molecular chaperone HtpG
MEKKQFQAESQRLLDMMINSIYTHNEIFLREIISNASDAMDKLAYLSLTDDKVGMNHSDFAIRISVDKTYRILTVSDNGIGMSKEDLEQNLGTIAKSGSLQFKQTMDKEQAQDVDIIGQFGVGFYSAFMVAEAITVLTRKYGEDQAWMWQSSGADGYTITPCEKDTPGTEIIMKLKADTEDENYSQYLEEYTLRELVKKYSDYIRYPIQMEVERTRPVEKPEGEETAEEDKDKAPEMETYKELETLNSMVPIWQRKKTEVEQADYDQFYKDKFYDYEAPVATIHADVEGTVTYKALLFVPGRQPMDYYTKDYKKGLQLYSSGVLIMENCEDLLPDHFRFVKGVVDTQDLSLNISREMLQHNRQLSRICTNLEKKIKAELKKLLENDCEQYEKFYAAFGLQLKYGITADYGAHKDLLKDLLLFWSDKEDKLVSLQEYLDAMPEDQKYIYFASGESRTKLRQQPQTELVRSKGYDVLLLTDEVDEFVMQFLMKFGEEDKAKEFKAVTAEDLGLETDEEKEATEKAAEENKAILDFAKETLGDRVKEVRLGKNLGTHPVSMTPDSGLSFEMEKYFSRVSPESGMKAGRILELNAAHPVFAALKAAVENDSEKAKNYVELLYCQALLVADLPLENPAAYTDLVCGLMQ